MNTQNMIKKCLLYIAPPILLTSIGEFILKAALNQLTLTGYLQLTKFILGTPTTLSALIMVITGGVLWLVAMSKFELSFLYPFLSSNLMIIVLGSHFILGEEVNFYRYLGVILIMIGLVIISKSPNKSSSKKQ
jgi:drug/metabolite transporter (DMT)-like permease